MKNQVGRPPSERVRKVTEILIELLQSYKLNLPDIDTEDRSAESVATHTLPARQNIDLFNFYKKEIEKINDQITNLEKITQSLPIYNSQSLLQKLKELKAKRSFLEKKLL